MTKRTPALGFILFTVLLDVIGIGIIIPIIPDLLMNELGVPTTGEASRIGGFLISIYAIVQFFFAPILGGLSDQYGRRPVILIALFGLTVDYLVVAMAPTLWWLFLARIVAGVCGASFTSASAYVADISAPEDRPKNFGMIGAAFGLGFILGPVVGGLLGEISTRLPFYVAAAITGLNFLYGFFILPESLSKENRRKFDWKRANPVGTFKSLKKYPSLKTLFIAFLIIYIASHAVQSNWAYFGKEVFDWSKFDIGLSLAIVGFFVAIVQATLIGRFVKKFGQNKTIYIGLAFNLIGFILFALTTEEWMIYAFLAVYVMGGLAGPTLQGIMSSKVPADEQGELMGAITSLQNLGNIIGPLVMTGTFSYFVSQADVYFPGAAFALGALFSIVSGTIIYKTISKQTDSLTSS
ncbi:TCR/Tet family MFS transporter [Roseivirga misakiensis]|uniref:Tetracycline resistance MFS efflux pump n=1 Tax=Roseivirga misakiensis TaxID=1563681 RepID=A0A1E5T0P0_9BACT|nr:TCR/Tet family MFS transporter [Roseivirga misakiensis]OEK04915.1 tetracycline resistance MFS efflux pump [Roseivirga misakiensis]